MPSISTSLKEDIYNFYAIEAAQKGLSVAQLIREILIDYKEKKAKQPKA